MSPWVFPVCVCLCLALATGCRAPAAEDPSQVGKPLAQSRAPRWDARGPLPMPWQGVSCVDMTPDGRFVAVGTIAPSGDPQVFLLDDSGRLVGQYRAGERWIAEVAVGAAGAWVAAVTTSPLGQSGDPTTLKIFAGGQEVLNSGDYGSRLLRFTYGHDSNHQAPLCQAAGEVLLLADSTAPRLCRLEPPQGLQPRAVYLRDQAAAPGIAFAASPSGRAVLGRVRPQKGEGAAEAVLVLAEAGQETPLWTTVLPADGPPAPALEPPRFGPPAPPCHETPLWAPLAVAIDREGKQVAAAVYPGWNRWFEGRGEDNLRFLPVPPTIEVYDEAGNLVRRWGPETFAQGFWCDLAFTGDGRALLAFPRSWTCRGLAGLGFLPADQNARTLYALSLADGSVSTVSFPDTIASVGTGGNVIAVACWDRKVYLLRRDLRPVPGLAEGIEVGAGALVRVSSDGGRILAAGADGVLRMWDAAGKEMWKTDLNQVATPGDKPWTKNQRLGQVGPGVWVKGGQRTHSDMGNQWIIEAPEGLLLIDPNAGLSIEQNWAQIKGAGLDPMKVKYVLLTHEHGDHAPGASLWRVLTGAQVVASAEMAYMLRYRTTATGYVFTPSQPVDVIVEEDQETLDLAGLKVTCVRTPGHTYGSLSYIFDLGGRRYCALGDLIMPGGALGYSGSLDFSAENVLASLRKLATFEPTEILGGHGGGEPDNFLAAGIAAGEATGWGKMKPEKPDPFFGFKRRSYLPVAWLQRISAAAYGDLDGDGRPDVVVAARDEQGRPALQVYLNKGGKFEAQPDLTLPLPEAMSWIRLLHLTDEKAADIYAATEGPPPLLFQPQGGKLDYRPVSLPGASRATQALVGDFNGDGRRDLLLGGRFVGEGYWIYLQQEDGSFRQTYGKGLTPNYFDMALVDVNGDGKPDLLDSNGDVLLAQADGSLPETPSLRLAAPGSSWNFMGVGDFNGDGRPDVALVNNAQVGPDQAANVWVYLHSGDNTRPYSTEPSQKLTVARAWSLRAGPTVADWNGDGRADLVLASSEGAAVIPGAAGGLNVEGKVVIPLDFQAYHDTPFGVADFSGSGRSELASWGSSAVGAPGVYLSLRD